MAVETGPAALRFRQPASERNALPDNRLAFIDQAAFLGLRAIGRPDGTDADQVFLRLMEQNVAPPKP